MRIGARDLLDAYNGSQRAVAEAYVKGELTGSNANYVRDVICQDDIDAARARIERTAWKMADRMIELEKEVATLKSQVVQLQSYHSQRNHFAQNMEKPMETLTKLTRRARQTEQAIKAEKARHQDAIKGLTDDLAIVQKEIKQQAAGLDCERIMHAEHVITIRGSWHRRGQNKASCVKDAITDLATNAGRKLVDRYFGVFGVKNYDQWSGQRSDHPYGWKPRHGHIVFAIGLTPAVRKRLQSGGELSPDECEAALYYLYNIDAITAAQKEARKEAAAMGHDN